MRLLRGCTFEQSYRLHGRPASVHGIGYFRPEYWHTDHPDPPGTVLGNVRLAFSDVNKNGRIEIEDDTEIMQESHYYPFGMNQLGPWYEVVAPENKYQYNGKELNEELGLDWYDYGARWYDGSIGRWNAVDPLAEERAWMTPYNYVQNNPILRIDPDGALDSPIFDENGNFLGTDSEGFKGDIIIMDADVYAMRIKDTKRPLDHKQVMAWAEHSPLVRTLDDYVANDFDPSNAEDKAFVENVFTNLIDAAHSEGLIEFSSADLASGKISVDNDTDYAGGAAATSTRSGGKHRISALLKSVSLDQYRSNIKSGTKNQFWYLGNSGDAINILGVHEPLHKDYPSRGGGPDGHGGMNREILRNPKYRKVMSIASDAYRAKVKAWANGN